MPQQNTWEKEYRNPQLLKLGNKPRSDLRTYIKYLKKSEEKLDTAHLNILDLGSGTGQNANYLANLGNVVTGIEISSTAIEIAQKRAYELGVNVIYTQNSFGITDTYASFTDNNFDLVIDYISSNSLNEKERAVYLEEVHRVLKPNGYFFVKALCKDGDKNAKHLLKESPGPEPDTYIIKEMNLTERVFSEQDFRAIYAKHFQIEKLLKKSNYAEFNGKKYKRNYWVGYLRKR